MPTALITGAGGGLGSAIAAALAPTHTLLLAGRPSKRLDAVARAIADIVATPPDGHVHQIVIRQR
jgi:NADP-dependent 3-hydroxy acid dehydrogenase YdfG